MLFDTPFDVAFHFFFHCGTVCQAIALLAFLVFSFCAINLTVIDKLS